MKMSARASLLVILALVTFTGGEVGELGGQAAHEGHGKQEAKKSQDLDMEGLTMDSIKKEGKMVELSPGTVSISSERQQLIGVKIGTVESRRLQKVIRTTGRVDYDEKRLATISPKIGGWVEDLYVDFTGVFVKKGDPLLTIYSPELVSTQEEYLVALRARDEFMKSPFPEVASSGNSLAESAKRRLKLWDISEDQIKALEQSREPRKTLTLYSPYEGFLLERMAYKGMNVMPGMALFKLADLSVVWIYADIYEYELPLIRLGQEASVRLAYLPSETFTGKVIYIYPSLDPKSRTAKVRLEFPNPKGRLKPEMYADVNLKIDLGEKLAVPEGAVIDTGVRQVAFIDKGSGYFEPREVKLGVKVDNYYEVIKGLKPGERVVTSANFLIDSESSFKEAVGGMAGMDMGAPKSK
jgi:membrane fusion protein, copper/silver efflux system